MIPWCGAYLFIPSGEAPPAEPTPAAASALLEQVIPSFKAEQATAQEIVQLLKAQSALDFYLPPAAQTRQLRMAKRVTIRLWRIQLRHLLHQVLRAAVHNPRDDARRHLVQVVVVVCQTLLIALRSTCA